MKRQRRYFVAIFFLASAALLVFALLYSQNSWAAPTINWNPPSIIQTIATGSSKTIQVSFTASENISNVVARVVPELQPFVQTDPTTFANIIKGQTYNLSLILSAAADSQLGTFEGTVQLKSGSGSKKTFSKPLPVTITVEQGDVSFSTPPDLEKVITDPEGGIYPVNQVLVDLIDEATRTDAEEIASSVNGKIIGFIPPINMYQLEVPTDTIAELDVVIDNLESDPRVESAMPNIKFYIGPPF